jgi:hypothetical protein
MLACRSRPVPVRVAGRFLSAGVLSLPFPLRLFRCGTRRLPREVHHSCAIQHTALLRSRMWLKGNASLYSTAADLRRWLRQAVRQGHAIGA